MCAARRDRSVGAPVEDEPGGAAFLASYEARGFEDAPSTFGPHACDAANILIAAAGGALAAHPRMDETTRAGIVARIQAITNADLVNPNGTVTGEIGFDAFGDTLHPALTLYRVDDGAWTPLEP